MRRKTYVALLSALVCLAAPTGAFLLAPGSPQPVSAASAATVGGAAAAEPFRPLPPSGAVAVPGMEKAAENQTLALFVNEITAEVAVYDKRTGKVWYSNPQDRDGDAKATPFEKESLASQFTLTFSDDYGNSKTLLSFNDAVKNKQFKLQASPDGLSVLYRLGDMSKGIDVLPKFISKDRLDSFMAKVDKDKSNYVYRKYELQADKGIYQRFDEALASDVALSTVVDAFKEAGYTDDDLAKDNEQFHVTADSASTKPNFTVPLVYKLDGASLLVRLPVDQLKEPAKYPVTDIQLFKYFAAAGLKDVGYMLVPDGSGSLIHLNNGKSKSDIFSVPVYGSDEAIRTRIKEQNSEGARLPVFGLKAGDAAMYGVIESGAAVASINAEVSGRTNSYNYAYPDFTIRKMDELPLGNGQTFNYVKQLQNARVKGDLTVRYGFLSGSNADYAGMANAYRDELTAKYGVKPVEAGKETPFDLDLVGSIPKRKSFLGIPYEAMEPLTTFAQARSIVDSLQAGGVANLKLRYLGWFNNGVNHKPPTSLSVDGELGGKRGLLQLAAYLKSNGVAFYPDVSFLHVFHDTWSFSPSNDASRYIMRSPVEKYPYDPALLTMNPALGHYYLLSPVRIPAYVERFLGKYKPLGIAGLSLRYMGMQLDPDYKPGRTFDRQEAADTVVRQLKSISGSLPDVMVTGGNAYALPYAKAIVDAPMTDTRFNITDETVPFYQMVVHGLIPYSGKPFNLADDQDLQHNMLKAIEYGASVRFEWMAADASAVKDTAFNNLYSIQYGKWLDQAKAVYAKVNQALADVQQARMVSHVQLREGVFATTYANGKAVIVNYTDRAVIVKGLTVEANNFALLGGNPR